MPTYRGLTWDHPRGRAALEEAVRRSTAAGSDLDLHWDTHSLEGFESSAAPTTWKEVDALADQRAVALSLAGPHAFLTFSSVCVALGEEPGTNGYGYVSRPLALAAIELLTRLANRAPEGSDCLNPIAMLEQMATTDSIAYCPLIYGYVNYARVNLARPLTFVDAPAREHGGRPGSTMGGTGLALTHRSEPGPELLVHLRWLLAPRTQRTFIPEHEGQPSAIEAWEDALVNQASGNFYRNTRRTIEQSWVRPRYGGYITFQAEASALIRSILSGDTAPQTGLDQLQRLYSASSAHTESRPA